MLMYAGANEPSGKIIVIYLSDDSAPRLVGRMKPGHLGLSLFTHDTDDIEGLYQRLKTADSEVITPPLDVEDDSGPYRVMIAKGPNEELFEFTQR